MEEIWKQYRDTVYSVSNTGYVKNAVTDKILSPVRTRQGYYRLTIWHNKLSYTIALHRMVAEAFLDIEPSKNIVNHKDGNPSNNRVDNLEWTTISDNVKHAYATGLAKRGEDNVSAKLSEEAVIKIIECLKSGQTVSQTAKTFEMSAAAVSNIWNGRTWKHLKRELPETKNYKGKLRAIDIPDIRDCIEKGFSDNEIAAVYSVHRASINNIRRGKNWINY